MHLLIRSRALVHAPKLLHLVSPRSHAERHDRRIGAMTRFVQLLFAFATLTLACGASTGSWRIHRRVPSFAGVSNLAVGSAAAYELDGQKGKSTVELAIVGTESVDGFGARQK